MRRKIAFCFAMLFGLGALAETAPTSLAAVATQPASTQPILTGRDTPAGAMNVLQKALEDFDLATVADSYNLPDSFRDAFAWEQVSSSRFCAALSARFGQDATALVYRECRIPATKPTRLYTSDDWHNPVGNSDVALGTAPPGKVSDVPMMQKGPDGIWRLGRILPPRARAANLGVDPRAAQAADLASKLDNLTPAVQAGKFATPDDVIHALFPEGSPMARARAIQEEQKKQDQKQEAARNDELLATKFDPSTLAGAIGAFTQARVKKDAPAMAGFYFAQNAPDDTLPKANARRILSAIEFANALRDHVDANAPDLAELFGIISANVAFPDLLQFHENGDRAVGVAGGPNQDSIWLQRVGGIWKQDITPEPPITIAQRAGDMGEDSAAIEQITTDIVRGKLKTIPGVRDALGAAMLNATPDAMFARDMRVIGEAQPVPHRRPDVHGSFPATRLTPAGAMNGFVGAIENLDMAGLTDALFMPEDKDGACRRAAASDIIVGMKFLGSVEARFGAESAQRICFAAGVIQRYSLRQYTDDEWVIPPEYPDLALGSGAEIRMDIVSGGVTVTNYVSGWTPIMHRGADGIWRIGPRFPENARSIRAKAAAMALKDTVLEKSIVGMKAEKYTTPEDLLNAIIPGIPRTLLN